MGSMQVEKKDNASGCILEFKGVIDETAVFPNVDGQPATITLNMKAVTLINSCGIREWMKWLKTLPTSSKLIYSQCPSIVVDQLNMLAGFLPSNASVESFYVPYLCEKCDDITDVLLNTSEPAYQKTTKCSKCAEQAEIDVIETKYFEFLKKKN